MENLLFTDEELISMIANPFPNSLWEKAFKTYNKEKNMRLNINCRPCYNKVFAYFLTKRFKYNKTENGNTTETA